MENELAAEWADPSTLRPWAGNPRLNDSAVAPVAESIRRFGFGAPLVARRATREVIAGHTRLRAALSLGLPRVPVRFMDIDESAARALALADNKLGELADWDDAKLATALSELASIDVSLVGLGWSDSDLRSLLDDTQGNNGKHDRVETPPSAPTSEVGSVYRLGRHGLVCGDSSDRRLWKEALAGRKPSMVWTDPPYGMALQTDYAAVGHGRGKKYERVIGDDRPFDPAPVLAAIGSDPPEQFWWGADYYRSCLPAGGSWFVWDKRTSGDGAAYDELFGASFELAWSKVQHKRDIIRILWAMSHGREDEDVSGVHPTQKPVALARWFLDKFSKPGDLVVDGFAGSGTLLVAAELSGRDSVVFELSPAYCDVIRARYAAVSAPVTRAAGE